MTAAHRVWAQAWAWRRSKGGCTAGVGEVEDGGMSVGMSAGAARKGANAGMGVVDEQGSGAWRMSKGAGRGDEQGSV